MEAQMANTQMAESIKVRFQETLKKVASDQALLDKVKNRSTLEALITNNTRDLAKAGIAQNELISELSTELQDALTLIKQGRMQTEELIKTVDVLRERFEKAVKGFADKFKGVFAVFVEEHTRIERVGEKAANNASRLDSGESVRKCVLDIQELARKKGRISPEKIFEDIVQFVRNRFLETILRNDDKRSICQAVADENFPDVVLDGIGCKMDKAIEGELDKIADELERYVQYKSRLVKLIDEFLTKRDIVDPEGDFIGGLIDARKKLNESQFEIALVGEFQGGKSTTFNMLCGGREISPRGLNGGGVKTSAAVITAQNIDGNETKEGLSEWAEVTWLKEEEIKRRIADVLKGFSDNGEQNITPDDFDDLIASAWEKSPKGDSRDRLRIATLQWRIVSSGKYGELTQRCVLPIDQFQHLVRFPESWERKWLEGGNASFSFEETLFSCLDQVLVRLHSPYLARLGCRVTDCPGLFVSQWDTERAEEVMGRSHAIWYLLGGDKQVGQGDERALTRIHDNQWDEKCFFSINCKKNEKAMQSILDTDKASLQNLGFCTDQVYLYNAFLSFRAAQIDVLSNVSVCKRDVECLAVEECEDEPSAERIAELTADASLRLDALMDIITSQIHSVGMKSLAKELSIRELPVEELAKRVRAASRSDHIVSEIVKFITRRRARSILVDQGTRKCTTILHALQEELQRQENDAKQALEEAQREVENAKADFEDFKNMAKKEFAFLDITALDEALTTSFFSEYSTEIRKTIIARAKEICIKEWHGKYYDADDVNYEAERRIKDEFIALIRSKLNVFVGYERLGKNPEFKKFILEPAEAALSVMRERWKRLQKTNQLFEGVEIKVEIDETESETFSSNLTGTIDVPWYSWELIKDFFTLGIRRIWQIPDDRIIEFFDSPDNPIGRAYDQFKGNDDNRAKICKYLGNPRRQYAQRIKDALVSMGHELHQNIERKQRRQKSKSDDRLAVAKRANEIRTTIVAPSQREIESFENEVRNIYG